MFSSASRDKPEERIKQPVRARVREKKRDSILGGDVVVVGIKSAQFESLV